MTDRLKLGVVENVGPNSLQAFLRQQVPKASSLDIAVGFVTASGLARIAYLLRGVAGRGHVRVLTGLFQGVTEPQALRSLLREQEQTKGRVSVRLSTNPHFHWKSYFILKRSHGTAIVGSSNLTKDGLQRPGELNVVLSMAKRSKRFRDLHGVFDDQWRNRAKPLQAVHIERYQKQRGTAARLPNSPVNVRKILKGPAQRRSVVLDRRYWRVCVDGTLSAKAESLIRETTDWSVKDLWYMSTGGTKFSIGDRVVLFHLVDKWLRVWRVADTTHTPEPTPDGRDFAAFKPVPGVPRRRLTNARWRKLKKANLVPNRTSARRTRRISEDRFNRFLEMLRDK
jgi:HKD family nuclease